jgi:chromate transporter
MQQMEPVKFGDAFKFWLKLGLISFGGPAGQISIMHQELVEKRRWISEKRFLHALNYCMVLPGPEAQQLATYIGWLMHRTWGGIVAGVLFLLPSLFLLIGLSWAYMAFGHVTWVAGLFYGIKPAVTAIVLQATHRIGSRALKHPLMWGLALAAFVALAVFNLPFPLIVLTAAAIGAIGGKFAPQIFTSAVGHKASDTPALPALIDDDTPTPIHARFRWTRLATVATCGAVLWAIPVTACGLTLGWSHPLTLMSLFFTKAAFLTFGGAYAVLPYVWQGAVTTYGWVTPPQMMDGLALGETTPGPLIMVVTFVGFVGGFQSGMFGADHAALAGIAAALAVTWFTFLPSFIFILAGGPIVESTHNNLTFTAPLTAITAAVVGVIANLALFFGYHVLWPQGFAGTFDWTALVIATVAAIALLRFKANVIHVILACALTGLVIKLFLPIL